MTNLRRPTIFFWLVLSAVLCSLVVPLTVRVASMDLSPLSWTAREGRCLVLDHGDVVKAVAFDSSDKFLATSGGNVLGDNDVRVWDAETGRLRDTAAKGWWVLFSQPTHPRLWPLAKNRSVAELVHESRC